MTRRFPFIGVCASLGFLLAAAGCNRGGPVAAANPAASGMERVAVGRAERKTLTLSTSQPGKIEAIEQAPLFAKIAGYVETVLVDIGDTVKKDQLLAKISIPEMQNDFAQKEALVAQAEAEVKQAQVSIVGAKAAVKSAEAQVAQSEAGIARAESDYQRWNSEHSRIKDLAANRAVTEKLVDETLNQLRSADASRLEVTTAVRSSKAALEEAHVSVQKAEADWEASKARLRVAESNLARMTTLLEYTTIKAPFDGVVTRRLVDTGHYVTSPGGPTSQPLLVVCRTDIVRIFCDVPELEAELVDSGEKGDKAEVRVQALGNKLFTAKVTRIGWSLDATNRSLRTEIDVPNPGGVLRPGMFATATIILEERPNVVTLPATAVVREGGDCFVCCVEGGKVERRKIETGLRSGTDIEIRSGLSPEQPVVLSGSGALKAGQAVEDMSPAKK